MGCSNSERSCRNRNQRGLAIDYLITEQGIKIKNIQEEYDFFRVLFKDQKYKERLESPLYTWEEVEDSLTLLRAQILSAQGLIERMKDFPKIFKGNDTTSLRLIISGLRKYDKKIAEEYAYAQSLPLETEQCQREAPHPYRIDRSQSLLDPEVMSTHRGTHPSRRALSEIPEVDQTNANAAC
jgi:hypothetical protein